MLQVTFPLRQVGQQLSLYLALVCLVLPFVIGGSTVSSLWHKKRKFHFEEANLQNDSPGSGLGRLDQSVRLLTQRMATLEGNIEARLKAMATREDSVLEKLSRRLQVVDTLVAKMDALDDRLSRETTTLKRTLTHTNDDIQMLTSKLRDLDSHGKTDDTTRHEVRSSITNTLGEDIENQLIEKMVQRVGQVVDTALQQFSVPSLSQLYTKLHNNFERIISEMHIDWIKHKEEVKTLASQTFTVAKEARLDLRRVLDNGQHAVNDFKNLVQDTRDDIVTRVKPSTNNEEDFKPLIQKMNTSMMDSIQLVLTQLKRMEQEDKTQTDIHLSRRWVQGTSGHLSGHSQSCLDPETVSSLQQVKTYLEKVFRNNESMRRRLEENTSKLLKELMPINRRVNMLVRNLNAGSGSRAADDSISNQIEELRNLVESSLNMILHAQSIFTASCNRIQEPSLEKKIIHTLDLIVEHINMSSEATDDQLTKLHDIVKQIGDEIILDNDPPMQHEMLTIISQAKENINETTTQLERVEERINNIRLSITMPLLKEPVDELTTATKDIKGYISDQSTELSRLYRELSRYLKKLRDEDSPSDILRDTPSLNFPVKSGNSLNLSPECTASLIEQLKIINKGNSMEEISTDIDFPEEYDDDEDEDDIPAWYTDPVFLSGHYGTPDNTLPVFRDDEWFDIEDSDDLLPAEETTTQKPKGQIHYFPIFDNIG
ncbi:unnamed protein product [Meganyctiphanes norvegica]|uniref:Uncharacterized protein n=1 Tax=Meganyctiphanes norvegica TaxID=48144 RepID=A0AAV2QH67_MEGNR